MNPEAPTGDPNQNAANLLPPSVDPNPFFFAGSFDIILTQRYTADYSRWEGNMSFYAAGSGGTGDVLRSVSHTGTSTSYTYESGLFDEETGEFTWEGEGEARKTTTTSFAINPGSLAALAQDPVTTETWTDYQGLVRREITRYLEEVVSETVHHYDPLTRERTHSIKDGVQIYSSVRPEPHIRLDTDATGSTMRTVFGEDGEVLATAKMGHDGAPDLVSTTQESGLSHTSLTQAGNLRRSSTSVMDSFGRTVASTDEEGQTTTYAYELGGRRVTQTLPNGATRITESHLDGRTLSVTGTGVVPTFYFYELLEDGSTRERVHQGEAESPRWQAVTRNALGWTTEERRPLPDSNSLESFHRTTHYYNDRGQKIASVRDGVARELFHYDHFGRLGVQGLDVDGNWQLDLEGSDFITVSTTGYENQAFAGGTFWWQVSSTGQFIHETGDAPLFTTRTSKRKIGGSGIHDITLTQDSDGLVESTVTVALPAQRTVITTHASNRSAIAAQRVVINGLLRYQNGPLTAASSSYSYDGLERPVLVTDATGLARLTVYDDLPDGLARSRVKEVRLRPLGADAFELETAYTYGSSGPDLGQVITTTNAAGDTVHYRYNLAGQMIRQFGPATYPVAYGYDALGQRTSMHTFRNEPEGAPEGWNLAAGDLTQWVYDAATGLLKEKIYGQGSNAQTLSYTYDPTGQLHTRTGGRGAVTTYSRNTLGRLTEVSYTGIPTPGYTMTYHRNGALKTVTDGLGTRTFTPRALDAEGRARLSLTGSTLLPEAEVVEEYDAGTGQRTAWALNFGATQAHEVGYSYTETGLLGSVTLIEDAEPLAHWAHDYAPAMARVARVQGRLGAAGLVHTATSFFDEHLRVEQVAHFAGTQLRQGWSYRFDPLRPQRRVGRTDLVAERPGWAWGYNGRGEVTSAQRIQSVAGAAPVAGQGWGYGYDAIGNRLQATRSTAQVAVIDFAQDDSPSNMNTTYSPNGFNQYAGITRPLALEVSGVTDPAVPEVTLSIGPDDPNATGLSTLELPVDQTRPAGNGEPGGYGLWVRGTELMSLGQWPLLNVTATRPAENPNDPPVTQAQSGRVWVRPSEAPVHDADGNLVSDGGWTYQWDAENRLIAAEMKADGLPEDLPQKRMEFHYDWLSRRVVTVTKSKAPNAATWSTLETRHFWYDGWNLMAETVVNLPVSGATGSVAVTHRYAWGVDLGGSWETGVGNHGPGRSQTAAGGVGALLGVIAPNNKTYSATHDANGNVMGFIDMETGVLAARFDYDAFGTLITDWCAPGHNAWDISRIRFSGKYQDPHTGWLYYGYRYLDTVNGRWLSRDPIEEQGGINLYGFVNNDPVNGWDLLGMAGKDKAFRIGLLGANPDHLFSRGSQVGQPTRYEDGSSIMGRADQTFESTNVSGALDSIIQHFDKNGDRKLDSNDCPPFDIRIVG